MGGFSFGYIFSVYSLFYWVIFNLDLFRCEKLTIFSELEFQIFTCFMKLKRGGRGCIFDSLMQTMDTE